MPITASSGGLTYLKGGSGFGAYDWWVAYNSDVTYNGMEYVGDKFYITGTDDTVTAPANRSFFASVYPDNIQNPTWSNRILFGSGYASGSIATTFGINPNTNILLQTGAWGYTSGAFQVISGEVGYFNTDGSLIQLFDVYTTSTPIPNINNYIVPGPAFYKNNNFYSIGVNTTASFVVSSVTYAKEAITFTKYKNSTTSLAPPQIYRLITFGANTASFSPYKIKLAPNGNFIVSGSYTTTIAPNTRVPFVFSSGELTTNWSKQFNWVNMFNGQVIDIAVDSNNNTYVAITSSFGVPARGVVVKLDSSGNMLWNIIVNSGPPTAIACDDNGFYLTSVGVTSGQRLIWGFDANGNVNYVNQLVSASSGVTFSNITVIGGALYCVGNFDYGAIWKLPKDGSIPGDGNYTIGAYTMTYSAASYTAPTFGATMTNLPLFETSPAYSSTSQATYTIDTTTYPNTFVPLT